MKKIPDLVALVEGVETDDFLVLCSLVITRAVYDLGAGPAALFFASGVTEVASVVAAAEAAPVEPKH